MLQMSYDRKIKNKPEELARLKAFYTSKIEHIVWREQLAAKSVKRLNENTELNSYADKCCKQIAGQGHQEIERIEENLSFIAKNSHLKIPAQLSDTKAEAEMKRLIPKRLFRGSLCMDAFRKPLGEKEYEWYEQIAEKDLDFSKKMLEIINLMDGKRTAHEINRAISAEYTQTDPENTLKFLKDLQKIKLITFK
jgi:hypothetical protein